MATINHRQLWEGAIDDDSDYSSDSDFGELKDDAVYTDEEDYEFDWMKKEDMNPNGLNMEKDLVSIGSSDDEDFHVNTAAGMGRGRGFVMDDEKSYDSDSSYEIAGGRGPVPTIAGLRKNEFEHYVPVQGESGRLAENEELDDADLLEGAEEILHKEDVEKEFAKSGARKGSVKGEKVLEELKAKGVGSEKYKNVVREALKRAQVKGNYKEIKEIEGMNQAVVEKADKLKEIGKKVEKLREKGQKKAVVKALQEESQIRETLRELEEDDADDLDADEFAEQQKAEDQSVEKGVPHPKLEQVKQEQKALLKAEPVNNEMHKQRLYGITTKPKIIEFLKLNGTKMTDKQLQKLNKESLDVERKLLVSNIGREGGKIRYFSKGEPDEASVERVAKQLKSSIMAEAKSHEGKIGGKDAQLLFLGMQSVRVPPNAKVREIKKLFHDAVRHLLSEGGDLGDPVAPPEPPARASASASSKRGSKKPAFVVESESDGEY